MRRILTTRLLLAVGLVASLSQAQQTCVSGLRVDGVVTDSTWAVIPGAQIHSDDGTTAVTDKLGHYILYCIPTHRTTLTIQAEGFATRTTTARAHAGEAIHVNVQLAIASVQTDVQVVAENGSASYDRGAGTIVLNTESVRRLADDPDDFMRQLQVLASTAGGGTGAATVMVDGFRNPSAMPPKGSISSITINADLFDPEFQTPAWFGGLIQVFTKPGADSFHGAAFFTDSDSSFNATDPFSLTGTPASKRRYGFELTGPAFSKKTDFSLALEKRDINEFNVVDAETLAPNGDAGADGAGVPFQQTVSAPQRLWIGSARGDWQANAQDTAMLSFSANANSQGNQGVGGLVLADAGYNSFVSEYDLRFSNVASFGANFLNQTRVGFTWKRTEQAPLSSSPSLQVAGYFTGGGAISQDLNNRERDLEIDDDAVLTRGRHEFKFGVQSTGVFVHDYDPNTFNGQYIFGGGSAPVLDANNRPTGQTTVITALQQYSRALDNLPGGTPTVYQVTTGNPVVPMTQWEIDAYAQGTFSFTKGITISTGLRYQLQTNPATYANVSPRIGIAWSPDKKKTWVLHARLGLFYHQTDPRYVTEVARLDGTRQQETTVYSPDYSSPLTPVAGSIAVSSVNQFEPTLHQDYELLPNLSVEHDFPHQWHASTQLYTGQFSGLLQIKNVNAPLVSSSVGTAPDPTAALMAPRPFGPNENIFQYGNFGHTHSVIAIADISQHSYKRFGFTASYTYLNVRSDGGDMINSPQSSYSKQGELSRIDWNSYNNVTFIGNVVLPYKVNLDMQFDARAGIPYNVITGTDNNGDGIFNDRPSFASAPGAGVFSTPLGLLTANTVNGDVPRNYGTMPGVVHLDANLSRSFILNPSDQKNTRSLTLNIRSANLLNHTNVTAVNNVLSSSLGQPVTAETARRVELGARFSF
jgi:hypothetical protein